MSYLLLRWLKKTFKFEKSIETSANVNFNIPNFSLDNIEAGLKVGTITTNIQVSL